MRGVLNKYLSMIPQNMIPMVAIGVIIFVVMLFLLFILLCIIYINARPAPIIVKKESPKKEEKKEDTKTPCKIRHEDIPILSGRIGEILALTGIIGAGPITKIFLKVLEIINESTYDIRWRYNLPFFMIIGPNNSGKTTLLNNLNFESLTTEENPAINSMWKLFKKGAIFEPPRADEDEKKFWSFLSEIFVFIRPRRPLDGIILTLPIDILRDESKIEAHAEDIFKKIFTFQKEINFRLPIYLVITKTDLIEGFSEFAYMLNKNTQQQIFGWSCPYSLNSIFSVSWIDEIFNTIRAGVRKATIQFAGTQKLSSNLEKAILFQTNLSKIRSALSKYLITMFKTHDPKDGLILRGVYFTGKPKELLFDSNNAMEMVQFSSIAPKSFFNPDSYANAANGNLYFVEELFSEKIFKEYNLASPIKVSSIDITKSEYRNKLIITGCMFVFSVGWFYGNNKIKNKFFEYHQSLVLTKNNMQKIKYLENNITDKEGQETIHKMTANLLQNMPVIKKLDTISIFVPQSWFTSLRRDIMDTLGLVFDSVVLRAMYIDLSLNTKSILVDEEHITDDHSKKNLFDVTSFQSFKKLKLLVERLTTLERISTEYNSVRHMENRKGIVDLSSSFFKRDFEIVDAMKSRLPNQQLVPPSFELEKFQKHIEQKLEDTFLAFLKDVFDNTIEKILQSIEDDIENLKSIAQNPRTPFSSQELTKLYAKVVLISDIFKNKNIAWIAQPRFSPTTEYADLIESISSLTIIDPKCPKELIKLSEMEFGKLKYKLQTYKTEFTEHMLEKDTYAPSEGFETFSKELKFLLDQPFINIVPEREFKDTVPGDKMLIWDVKKLKNLSEQIDKFYEFSAEAPADIRPQFFETYKAIAQKCFHPSIKSLMASAEIFDDLPLGNSRNLLEEAYQHQALNIKNVSISLTKIVKLLDEMQDDNSLKDFGFSTLIVSQYVLLLEKIDALLSLETPYSSGKSLFNSWTGDSNPKFLNISEEDYLKKYLLTQFERIKFLAKDLAEPVVDLLSAPHINEKVRNRNLLEKWKAIIENVNDYEQKKPGNSLEALENFVSGTLSTVSADSVDPQGEIESMSRKKGDFFLEKRSEIAKALLSRADIIQYDKAAAAYNTIRDYFNENLRNKFPFADSIDEISVQDLENFVELYKSKSKNLIEALEKNKNSKNINKNAIDFVKKINSLMPFMQAWIQHSKTASAADALIAFNIDVRPSPEAEAFTSSVFGRTISVGNNNIQDKSNAIFFNNDNVKITFEWVASSNEQPYKGTDNSGEMSIKNSKVTFSYGGKWAMLRLLEKNKTNKEVNYESGVPVQFSVPITNSRKGNEIQTTKLILKITPMIKENDKFVPLSWPVFPHEGPVLHLPDEPKPNEQEKAVQNEAVNLGEAVASPEENNQPKRNLDVNVSFDE